MEMGPCSFMFLVNSYNSVELLTTGKQELTGHAIKTVGAHVVF